MVLLFGTDGVHNKQNCFVTSYSYEISIILSISGGLHCSLHCFPRHYLPLVSQYRCWHIAGSLPVTLSFRPQDVCQNKLHDLLCTFSTGYAVLYFLSFFCVFFLFCNFIFVLPLLELTMHAPSHKMLIRYRILLPCS